jgi:hypothetical protein
MLLKIRDYGNPHTATTHDIADNKATYASIATMCLKTKWIT